MFKTTDNMGESFWRFLTIHTRLYCPLNDKPMHSLAENQRCLNLKKIIQITIYLGHWDVISTLFNPKWLKAIFQSLGNSGVGCGPLLLLFPFLLLWFVLSCNCGGARKPSHSETPPGLITRLLSHTMELYMYTYPFIPGSPSEGPGLGELGDQPQGMDNRKHM